MRREFPSILSPIFIGHFLLLRLEVVEERVSMGF
jgi:hypothetical protein